MTIREAIQHATRSSSPRPEGAHSHFLTVVRGKNGRVKHRGAWRHNLTTDTAVGYTNRRDWQSKLMGGGIAPSATWTGFATSVSATALNNTGASFPTSGQGLAGRIVVAGPNNAGTGAVSWGIIASNTGTQLVIDAWHDPATWGTGSTPNGTCAYCILPGNAPAMWLAVTADAGAPAATDTTLASEITTDGFARALATYAHVAAAATYSLQVVYTAGGTRTINKEAVFAAANPTGGGAMPFESAEPSPPTLVSGDTLTQTVTVTI